MPSTRSGRSTEPPDYGESGEQEVTDGDSEDEVEDQQNQDVHSGSEKQSKTPANTEARVLIRENTTAYAMAQKAKSTGGDTKFNCSICGRSGLQDRAKLEVHLRRHLKEHICACSYCGRPFYDIAQMNTHVKKRQCLGNQRSLRSHEVMETHETATGPGLSCPSDVPSNGLSVTETEVLNNDTSVLPRDKTRAWAIAQKAKKTDGKFSCFVCGVKTINDRSNLETHLRRHFKEHICACEHCNRPFTTLSEMNAHQQNSCSQHLPEASGNSHQDLDVVMDTVQETSPSVDVRSTEYESKTNIQKTKSSAHMEGNRKQTRAYKMSQKAKRNKNGYICEVCGKSSSRDRYDLEVHLRIHFDEDCFECHKCHQQYRSFNGLKSHTCVSEENENIDDGPGKLCKREETRAYKMSTEVEKTQDGQFGCSICPLKFLRRGKLEIHLRRHFQEYVHACDTCGKKFFREWEFTEHKKGLCTLKRVSTDSIDDAEESKNAYQEEINNEMTETGQAAEVERSNSESRDKIRKARKRPVSAVSKSRHSSVLLPLSSANLRQKRKILLQRNSSSNVRKKIGFHQVSRLRPRSATATQRNSRVITRNTVSKLCTYCRKAVPAHERKEHRQQHHKNGDKYGCKYCDKIFANAKYRSEHEVAHTGRVFQCSDCSKEFKYRTSLRTHRLENCHGPSQPAELEVPRSKEQKFADFGLEALIRKSLESPKLNQTGRAVRLGKLRHDLTSSVDTTTCTANSRKVKTPSSAETKDNNYILERKLKCDYCPSAFTSTQLKKCHEKSHESLVRKKLDFDIERLRDSVTRNNFASENPFECDFCDSRFTDPVQATAHTGKCHGFDIAVSISSLRLQKEQKKVPMAVNSVLPVSEQEAVLAANAFVTQENLNVTEPEQDRQRDTIFLEKKHPAAVKFNSWSSEKTENFNLGVKKYKCGYCEATYTTSYQKNYHENKHKGLTPYRCGICEKQFYSAISRNHHRRSAHGPKKIKTRGSKDRKQKDPKTVGRYECEISEANYKLHAQNRLCTQNKILGVSVRRPSQPPKQKLTAELFECSHCAKQLKNAWNLKLHERLHTGDLPYICTVCNQRYNSERDLKYHLVKVHRVGDGAEKNPSSVLLCKNEVQLGANQFCDAVEESQMKSENSLPRKTSDGMYQCGYCSLKFKKLHQKRYHEYRHTGVKPYKCDVCDQCFTRPSRRLEHRIKAHGVKGPVKSPGCNPKIQFGSSAMNRECESRNTIDPKNEKTVDVAPLKTPPGMFGCSFCNKLFKTAHQKRYHENLHKSLKPYKCDVCDKRFRRPGARWNHRRIEHGLRGPVAAPGCNPGNKFKRFPIREKVDGFYKCNYCEKKCARLDGLRVHERLHTGEKPYTCSFCDKRFPQLTAAKQHMRNNHHDLMTKRVPNSASENPVHYDPSRAASVAPEELSHEPFVEIEQVHRCQHCDDEFSHQEILERHVQVVHIEKRPFNCQTCQRGFFAAANYEKHVRNNLCDKASLFLPKRASKWTEPMGNSVVFECSYCSKQFSNKGNLIVHEQRHTGEAAFGCHLCSRVFKTNGDRLNHMQRVHGQKKVKQLKAISRNRAMPTKAVEDSGTRGDEYPCRLCDAGFAEEDLLKAHIRDVHVQLRPYQCQDCHRGFFSEAAFQRHERQQLCRKVAETASAVEHEEDTQMDTREEADENGEEEASEVDIKPQLQQKLHSTKYPWIREILNGPFVYECEECDAKFTREIIAEDHRRWHAEWDSKLKKSD